MRKGIILETDGQPNAATAGMNATSPGNYCLQANDAATAAKHAGIEVFTIGFGLDGTNDATCPDTSGTFRTRTATYLLSTMATQPSTNSRGCPGTGAPTTNTDGDHSFCLPKTAGASASLASVFQAAAAQLATGGARLIELYPAPVATAVSPASGSRTGGTTVTITGPYFTGSTRETFGGVGATSFTINSDPSISATAPAGTAGQTVDIVVTSPAGSSAVVTADRYTYD